VLKEHVVANIQRFDKHQAKYHSDVVVQLFMVLLFVFADIIQRLNPVGEAYDQLIVDVV
jgi:hypothetical protein